VKRYGKYRRKATWILKIYWKCGRKLWNDMENMEERQVDMWNDMENTEENTEMRWKLWKKSKLNSEKNWKIQKKIVKWYGKYGRK
jgi:hypothetical protein